MKIQVFILGLLTAPLFAVSQVGIGTTTPNLKSVLDLSSTTSGFLIPRMTGLQKAEMSLTPEDMGMMIFQTDVPQAPLLPTPKGMYFFDGNSWISPMPNGAVNGQTLRWDGNKWVATSNLFNQGSSVGIGTVAPNVQLQIHTNAFPTTRIQLTSGVNNALAGDGLLLGVALSNGQAHLIQQENRALWFGTNAIERVRIDSVGNVGIGSANPSAKLDVNGSVRLGTSGSVLNGILKSSLTINIPILLSGAEGVVEIPFPGVIEGATVYVSPGSHMSNLMIGYARAGGPGVVEVKFMNMGDDMNEVLSMLMHISIIQ